MVWWGYSRIGSGPRLLIRTDLDALPIVEETGSDAVPISDSARRQLRNLDRTLCFPLRRTIRPRIHLTF